MLGAALTYTEAAARRGRLGAARARRGLAHRRLAADPQSRHDRRQSRHGLARRRLAAAAADRGRAHRAGRHAAATAHAATRRSSCVGPKRNALAGRRARRGDPRAPVARPADVHEGRAAQRDGDLDLLAGAVAPIASAASCAPRSARRGPSCGLVTAPLDEAESFAERVVAAASPIDDVRGTAAYRRHALGVLTRRALARCLV